MGPVVANDFIDRGKAAVRSLAHRLSGFSTPVFGVSWNPPVDEREIVRRLLTALEDRRVLFIPMILEIPEQVTRSVLELREVLTGALQELPEDSPANGSIRAMRAACRKFLEDPRPEFRNVHPRHMYDRDAEGVGPEFFVALGELRAVFGAHIAALACSYGLEVEDSLATVLPPLPEE